MGAVIFCVNVIDSSNITRCINQQVFVHYIFISQCGNKRSLDYILTLKIFHMLLVITQRRYTESVVYSWSLAVQI
jgi:hypothetical protein